MGMSSSREANLKWSQLPGSTGNDLDHEQTPSLHGDQGEKQDAC